VDHHNPTGQRAAADAADALKICDKLNRRLGLARETWTAMAADSMRDGDSASA